MSSVWKKLWRSIWNWFRGSADSAQKKIQNTGLDAKFAIEDAEKQVARFTEDIRKVRAASLDLERQLKEMDRKIETLQAVAEKAAKSRNEADARAALEEKARITGQADALRKEIERTSKQYQNLIDLKGQQETRIRSAKNSAAVLEARSISAKIRKSANEAAAGLASSDALSALDELEAEVNRQEDEAEATEELADANTSTDNLVTKYNTARPDVDAELAKLMGR